MRVYVWYVREAEAEPTNGWSPILTSLGPPPRLPVRLMRENTASKAPPLSMVINTLELSDRQTPAAVVLSTSIKARQGREGTLRNLLESLVNDTVENQKDLVFTCTVNQVLTTFVFLVGHTGIICLPVQFLCSGLSAVSVVQF